MFYGSLVHNMAPLAIGRVASRISLRNAIYICVPRMTENLNLGLAESAARSLVMIYVLYISQGTARGSPHLASRSGVLATIVRTMRLRQPPA